jgi:hypothetical protein
VKTNFKKVLFILVILFLSNCIAPTKPNQSVIYDIKPLNLVPPTKEKQNSKPVEIPSEVQESLVHLYTIDSELAIELGRLPEFQHEMSPNTEKALKRFVNLVHHATEDEISKFKAIINEGIPEIRKFCTLLQAVIWYLEKDKIIDGAELFSWDYRRILRESWSFGSDSHWKGKDFNEVTDRLNSPLLVNYYVEKNFFYLSKNKNWNTAQDAISIFAKKEGNCRGYADFQCTCLKKAGYDAQMIFVKSPTGDPYHAVCEFKDKDGITYIMDNTAYKIILKKDRYTEMLPQISW